MLLEKTKKFNHFSLGERICDALEGAISKGELEPGEKLEEAKIAEFFGVSRAPVREGIMKLQHRGLVKIIPRRGNFVISLSYKEITDIMDVREVLESLAARLACQNLSEKDLKPIEEFFYKLEEEVRRGNLAEYPQKDLDFHKFIFKAAGNEKLTSMNRMLSSQIYLIRYRSGTSSRERAIQALKEHEAVLNAFKRQNPAEAEERMREHIRNSKENILKMTSSSLKGKRRN